MQEERRNSKSRGYTEKQGLPTTLMKEKVIEKEKVLMNQSSLDCDDIKLTTSTPKKREDKDEKVKQRKYCSAVQYVNTKLKRKPL